MLKCSSSFISLKNKVRAINTKIVLVPLPRANKTGDIEWQKEEFGKYDVLKEARQTAVRRLLVLAILFIIFLVYFPYGKVFDLLFNLADKLKLL